MPEDRKRTRKVSRDPRPVEEEVGATTGRKHADVLDQTLDEETARRAKMRGDRSSLD